MKNPRKETRDVIAKHVRWTEALRVVRAYHPEVTIILPQEKIQIYPGDDVRGMITPAVGVIRHALDAGVWQWQIRIHCRVAREAGTPPAQPLLPLSRGQHPSGRTRPMIEDLLFVHKA